MHSLRIAIVDDELQARHTLQTYLKRAAQTEHISISVSEFTNAPDLINAYHSAYDLLFLDIEMPGLNGIDAAKEIRQMDSRVAIVFVTNMAQYAICGYEVNAIDFMVKPVAYETFRYKFKKALSFCALRQERELVLEYENSFVRLPYSSVYYVEKEKNYLIYHTARGLFRERGTMQKREKDFLSDGFAKCASGCLVNLLHVEQIREDTVVVHGDLLPISRQRRKEFVGNLMGYLGR